MTKPKLPMFTTIVHGPSGCGKYMNAHKIKRAYGLKTIIEKWDGRHIRRAALHLTDAEPTRSREEMEKKCGFPLRVVTYEVAMEMVKIDEESKR